ncbi:hypothetical protein pb186bvf_013913 [Paramecium bursaria]
MQATNNTDSIISVYIKQMYQIQLFALSSIQILYTLNCWQTYIYCAILLFNLIELGFLFKQKESPNLNFIQVLLQSAVLFGNNQPLVNLITAFIVGQRFIQFQELWNKLVIFFVMIVIFNYNAEDITQVVLANLYALILGLDYFLLILYDHKQVNNDKHEILNVSRDCSGNSKAMKTSQYLEIAMHSLPIGILLYHHNGYVEMVNNSLTAVLKELDKDVQINVILQARNVHKDYQSQNQYDAQSENVVEECEKLLNNVGFTENNYTDRNSMLLSQESKMLCSLQGEQDSDNYNAQYFEITFKCVVKNDQNAVLLYVRDVTQFNQIKVLRTENENKSRILYEVTHEFRQPLNCIILMSQRLREKEQYQALICDSILLTAKQLLSLANDILDVAQINAGSFKLNFQEFSLRLLLKDISNQMRCLFEEKKIDLKLELGNVENVCSDSNRIRQILFNLIGNALKFTRVGSITVQVEEDEDIQISVIDTGLGIRPEDQNKLFKAFSKLDNSLRFNTQGVGLGLVISNILCQKLSGKSIKVVSDGKSGSSFTFYLKGKMKSFHSNQFYSMALRSMDVLLDFKSDCQQKLPPIFLDETETVQRCGCKDVLIVDDVFFNILALKMSLEKYNLRIDSAGNGMEAINMVRNYNSEFCCQNYKLILMDLEMPIMNGIVATQQLRKEFPDLLIYGCTGHDIDSEYKSYGMDGYFIKPVDPQKVYHLLSAILY